MAIQGTAVFRTSVLASFFYPQMVLLGHYIHGMIILGFWKHPIPTPHLYHQLPSILSFYTSPSLYIHPLQS
ncbi:hypothetical protein P3390_24900, partial [Vibrio parahaemolyticus]|nr:hypothetical protein [Vibrio parahaemolyticus]